MTQAKALQEARSTIGNKLARELFELRGNHSEMHLSEPDLANIIDCAIEWADKTRAAFADADRREHAENK
jgi:hypothetical protein